ncbi:MAG: ABC transporter permease subunit [Rhodobacteraceae bacterium]|nr:ABC transporter permease subunit [Paracoccaceae bacterium]
MILLAIYVVIFAAAFLIVRFIVERMTAVTDFTSLKTVTFGDESAVTPNRIASVVSVVTIFLIWGAFTGSKTTLIHMPGPFTGDASFSYTVEDGAGARADANVTVRVHTINEKPEAPETTPRDGFAQDDSDTMAAWRSGIIRVLSNDNGEDLRIVAIDGEPIAAGGTVDVADGKVNLTQKGSLNFTPDKGLQMEPIWLPSPEAVVFRFWEIAAEGYQNFTLLEHLGWSLLRVLAGFLAGSLIGIPLGYAMGLSGWFRGWFDPIVEFMRPVPPLALIPLVIIWFGIWETGKIILLFLAALWIMTIAARAGVSGVNISKIHAAYSLGASRWQILRYVIAPNSLPEIFTGARVAMGVCWGTVVAAELVAAQKGAGMMIIAASKFQLTDIVIMGIILIGIIGYGIDILMRRAENRLVPWKGRS